jgi:hypothetical protein
MLFPSRGLAARYIARYGMSDSVTGTFPQLNAARQSSANRLPLWRSAAGVDFIFPCPIFQQTLSLCSSFAGSEHIVLICRRRNDVLASFGVRPLFFVGFPLALHSLIELLGSEGGKPRNSAPLTSYMR